MLNEKVRAQNINTGELVHIAHANKNEDYMCPDCKSPILFCKGDKVTPYFRHKADSSCDRYNHMTPDLTTHLKAQLLLKETLESNSLKILKCCSECSDYSRINIDKKSYSTVSVEKTFLYNDSIKYADVACVNDSGNIVYIFEIFNTHKTDEINRPEPWFELDAKDVLAVNSQTYRCIRSHVCDFCKENKRLCMIKYLEYLEKTKIEDALRLEYLEKTKIEDALRREQDRIKSLHEYKISVEKNFQKLKTDYSTLVLPEILRYKNKKVLEAEAEVVLRQSRIDFLALQEKQRTLEIEESRRQRIKHAKGPFSSDSEEGEYTAFIKRQHHIWYNNHFNRLHGGYKLYICNKCEKCIKNKESVRDLEVIGIIPSHSYMERLVLCDKCLSLSVNNIIDLKQKQYQTIVSTEH